MADKAINGIDRFLHFANVMNENARADMGRARGTKNTGDVAKETGNGVDCVWGGGSSPPYKGTENGEINSGTGNANTVNGVNETYSGSESGGAEVRAVGHGAAVGRGAYSEISRRFRRVLDGGESYESRFRGGNI